MRQWKSVLSVGLAALCILSTVGCGEKDTNQSPKKAAEKKTEQVKLTFFQNKMEANSEYTRLIDEFQDRYPHIVIERTYKDVSEDILKQQVAKNETPDIIGIGATHTFTTLAQTGVFEDFSGSELLDPIFPAYVDTIRKQSMDGQVNGIPYTSNANGILYNKDLFADLQLSVPTTWSQLIDTAHQIQQKGKLPFYFTVKESWTNLVAFNALASNLQGPTFITDRIAGRTTFSESYKDIASKQLELMQFGNEDRFIKDYTDGNKAFAAGFSAMYLQGSWAIPQVKAVNPKINIGMFAFPVSDDPDLNRLVSGIDTVFTVSRNTAHPKEAHLFLSFLLEKENVKQYAYNQGVFPAVKGVPVEGGEFADIAPLLSDGRVIDYADHSFPNEMKVDKIVQEFLFKGKIDDYLKELDKAWELTADK